MVYMAPSARSLLWGGRGLSLRFSDTWEWDGEGWVQVADTGPAPRAYAGLAFDSRRNVAVLFTHWPPTTIRETWEWDGNRWEEVQNIGPVSRFGHAMTGTAGATLLFGGVEVETPPLDSLGDTWTWDGDHWRQRQDIGPSRRWLSAMSWDSARARGVLFGGAAMPPNVSPYLGDTWEAFEGV
jgi:hypothetical protein